MKWLKPTISVRFQVGSKFNSSRLRFKKKNTLNMYSCIALCNVSPFINLVHMNKTSHSLIGWDCTKIHLFRLSYSWTESESLFCSRTQHEALRPLSLHLSKSQKWWKRALTNIGLLAMYIPNIKGAEYTLKKGGTTFLDGLQNCVMEFCNRKRRDPLWHGIV